MHWMPIALLLVAGGALCAQTQNLPVGVVRGHFQSWQGTATDGSFVLRKSDGALYGCSYDAHTLVQRNQWPIRLVELTGGEPVEVVSDHKFGSRACYARMLSVNYARFQPEGWRPRPKPKSIDSFRPHGSLTFAGVVAGISQDAITLRTQDGQTILRLRPDTRFSGEGLRQEVSPALINKHVFVRGDRNMDGVLEAYHVVWGQILSVE